jgi:hypothetical protein
MAPTGVPLPVQADEPSVHVWHNVAQDGQFCRTRGAGRVTTRTDDRPDVVLRWDQAALDAIAATHTPAPLAARALAVVHTAMYDAWTPYDAMAVGTRLGDVLRRPPAERTEENKRVAVTVAAHTALVDLFPAQREVLDALLGGLGLAAPPAPERPFSPWHIGHLAAQAVALFRQGDGSNQLGILPSGVYGDYTGYEPLNTPDAVRDPNAWQPLSVPDGQGGSTVQTYLTPHWGLVQPFAVVPGSLLRPAEPHRLPYDQAEYRMQAHELLEHSAQLDDESKAIAEFWAGNPGTVTCPGLWCQFAQFVARRDHLGLDAQVKLFFAVASALLDAGIVAWDSKRAFNSERPVTAIRHLFHDECILAWRGPFLGTGLIRGQDWTPYQEATVVTPAWPEYASAHSTFSAAAAEVLRRFTGSDAFGDAFRFKQGTSTIEPELTPTQDVWLFWPTFSDAAAQSGMACRYGGVQFAEADLTGRALGRDVGRLVWDLLLTYWHEAPMRTRIP